MIQRTVPGMIAIPKSLGTCLFISRKRFPPPSSLFFQLRALTPPCIIKLPLALETPVTRHLAVLSVSMGISLRLIEVDYFLASPRLNAQEQKEFFERHAR